MTISRFHILGLVLAMVSVWAHAAIAQEKPNIVLILTDDLGYGDVSAYGATALQTSNIDRLAKSGLRFTDAHASAATCTPSRYSLLTGEHAGASPAQGCCHNAALIIESGRRRCRRC
jgi:arylsulfatase A-like enzyme